MEPPDARICHWCGDTILLFDDDPDWVHARTLWPQCSTEFQRQKPTILYATPHLYVIQEEAL